MRLRIRARLADVEGGESPVSKKPLVKMVFEATGQPELERFFDYYTTDSEVGLEFLKRTCDALDIELIRSIDQYELAGAIRARDTGCEVTLTLELKEHNGQRYLRPIRVEPVGGS